MRHTNQMVRSPSPLSVDYNSAHHSILCVAGAPTPNFISDVFFLLSAYNHYGLVRTITSHDALYRSADDIQRRLEQYEGDNSYQGVSGSELFTSHLFLLTFKWKTPLQRQVEQLIERMKVLNRNVSFCVSRIDF